MPRFFFDLHDNEVTTRDDTGTAFPDIEDAKQYALSCLPAIAANRTVEGSSWIEIRTETGSVLARVILTSAWSISASQTLV